MGDQNNDSHNLGFQNAADATLYVLKNLPSPLVLHYSCGVVMTGLHLKDTPAMIQCMMPTAYTQAQNSMNYPAMIR
jgi:hypothetical protein